ncbi:MULTISPECIES: stage III sporulation protein AD [Oceanobacillus]|uniref:Stage III sporulation protein AD n=1 Tax=Oceanobacillus indicireducens TaxID=1004261 RepID=A0A917Y2F1_9BACI|nr:MULTISPECIES: stage III sporulation protein AD [Oceanobacillus]GGN64031.1 stage III sporulation protein AD [Oceanobacillus indicireducens]
MDILQIVIVSIIASILFILLKDVNPTFAFFIVIVVGIMIFASVIGQIRLIFQVIQSLGDQANVPGLYLETILKIIGIAYIAELGASMTQDAGLQSVAKNIELAGKIFILLLAIPIITSVIEAIVSFLPTV